MVSIVVSVYNEEDALPIFSERLFAHIKSLHYDFEVIFVDDGSTDGSVSFLENLHEKYSSRIKIISFSRNFGHEAAMLAGLEHAEGKAIICLDADLQHPPECIEKMIHTFKSQNDIVLMKPIGGQKSGFKRQLYGKLFYSLLSLFSKDKFENSVSDFFLVSKPVKNILINEFTERNRFMRGHLQSIGFDSTILEFTPSIRTAGKSKYNTLKLLELSWNAFTGFSTFPLKASLPVGLLVGLLSLILLLYSLVMYLIGKTIDGYTTIVALVCLLFSYLAICLGIFGHYLAVIIEEVKKRPPYLIKSISKSTPDYENK